MSNNSKKIERLVLSIATNQFKGPLPTGKEIVTAVNERDQLLAEVARLREALEIIAAKEYDVWAFSEARSTARAALTSGKE